MPWPNIRIHRWWLVAGLVGVLALAFAVIAVAAALTPTPEAKARDLVTKIAARDATAADLLVSESDLPELIRYMGLLVVPASVSVAVEDFRTEPGPERNRFHARYTLRLSGTGGLSVKAEQSLQLLPVEGRLRVLYIEGALEFDLATYFSSAGASEDAAGKAAEDLMAGIRWIPGLTASSSSKDVVLTVPDNVTLVPNHLNTWSETKSYGAQGLMRVWGVSVTGPGAPEDALVVAEVRIKEPIPAQINKGALDEETAIDQAVAAMDKFAAAVEAGDLTLASSMVQSPEFPLTDSGLAAMAGEVGYSRTYAHATEGPSGAEVEFLSYVLVAGSDGTWSIDGRRSSVTAQSVAGNGSSRSVYAARYLPGVPFPHCTSKITIRLLRVDFETTGHAYAVFSFKYSNPSCSVGDQVTRETVGWKGNKGTADDAQMEGHDPAYLSLPEGVTPAGHPIWIKFTRYETSDGHALPGTLVFYTV